MRTTSAAKGYRRWFEYSRRSPTHCAVAREGDPVHAPVVHRQYRDTVIAVAEKRKWTESGNHDTAPLAQPTFFRPAPSLQRIGLGLWYVCVCRHVAGGVRRHRLVFPQVQSPLLRVRRAWGHCVTTPNNKHNASHSLLQTAQRPSQAYTDTGGTQPVPVPVIDTHATRHVLQ